MPFYKGSNCVRTGRFGNPIGHVDGVEVASGQKPVNRIEIDMVSVNVVGIAPASLTHGCVGGSAHAVGFGADNVVFAIRLVPHRHDNDAVLGRQNASLQLGSGLVGEAVPYAK